MATRPDLGTRSEPENRVRYKGHPAFRGRPLWLLACIILIPAFGLGLFLLFFWWIQNYSHRLRINTFTVTQIRGILNIERTEINIADIRTVDTAQNWWERILGIGTIKISTAGEEGYGISVPSIPSPNRVRAILDGRHTGNRTTD